MARRHDYASKGSPKKRSANRRGDKATVPGWVWLLAGLSLGLLVAFLVFLQGQPGGSIKLPKLPEISREQPKPEDTRAVRKPAETQAPKKEESGIEFNFYDILPNYEVAIPEKELEQPIAKGTQPSDYLLQAGSFRSAQDADGRRAQLALLGISSEVRTAKTDRGTWHRVIVGPFNTTMELDKMRRRMQDNQIDVLLIRQKK